MTNNAEKPKLHLQDVRRSVLVEFMIKDFKKYDKTYWEDDEQLYKDVKDWQQNSPMHKIRYVD
jgi:hypothetical protein